MTIYLTPNISDELRSAAKDPAFQQAVADGLHSANPADVALSTGLASQDVTSAGRVLEDSSIIQQLSPALAQPFKVGFSESMSTVFLSVTGVALVGLVLVFFWKEVPLRTAGGLAASAAARKENGDGVE